MSVWVRHEDGGFPYAGFWRRVIASLIDYIIQLPIMFGMMFLMFRMDLSAFTALITGRIILNPIIAMWYMGVFTGIVFFYFMLFESSAWQASPGKLLLGIKVTDISGRQVSMFRAAFRAWPLWADGVIYVIGFANDMVFIGLPAALLAFAACVVVAFTQRKQGLHDMMAGTLIVRRGAIFEDADAYH